MNLTISAKEGMKNTVMSNKEFLYLQGLSLYRSVVRGNKFKSLFKTNKRILS